MVSHGSYISGRHTTQRVGQRHFRQARAGGQSCDERSRFVE